MRIVYLCLGWVFGIWIALRFPQLSGGLWQIWTVLAIIAVIRLKPVSHWQFRALVVLFFTLGGLRYSAVPQSSDIARFNNEGGLTITGVIIAEPDLRENRVQVRVEVETVFHASYEGPAQGIVLVQTGRLTEMQYGDRIHATGLLNTPAEYDTFSYADFLARSGVFSVMRGAAVEVESSGHGNPISALLIDLKARASEQIALALPEPQAGLLTGILLGTESGISDPLADDFAAVGASHIIAISGFNMTLISGLAIAILGRALPKNKRLAAFIALVFISLYTLMVGASAAVLRAAIMSGLVIIVSLVRRRTYTLASLSFVVLALTAQNPTVLWDISFQLSFFATLGLMMFVTPLSRHFDALLHAALPRRAAELSSAILREPIIVSLAAQLTTLPLIVLYFQRLSLVSLPVNLLVVPIQAYLLIIGGLATLLSLIAPGLALVFYWIDLIFLSWSIAIVRLFARLDFADIAFFVDARLIGLYYASLIGGAIMYGERPRWTVSLAKWIRQQAVLSAVAASGLIFAILVFAMLQSRPDGYLHVWFLDMGHNNAVLIQTPGGAQFLVDGGSFPARLLTALGDRLPFYDREIEVLFISQPDEFDYGALPAVLERYSAGLVLMNGQPNVSESFATLRNTLTKSTVLTVGAGYNLQTNDGTTIEVLHPQQRPELGDGINDHVLTLRLRYGEASFLLTGDLSVDGQMDLLRSGQWPTATVLQLPQHGRARSLSDTFLEAAQPQIIALHSDPANRLGDPDGDTLAQVGDLPLFRTDEGGIIHMWTDGKTIWVVNEG